MSINDLFYTELVTLKTSVHSSPDAYGYIKVSYRTFKANVPGCVEPISTHHAQQKYGVQSTSTFECSIDYIDSCENVTHIVFEDVTYEVETFIVYPKFMCLPKSITYLLKKV